MLNPIDYLDLEDKIVLLKDTRAYKTPQPLKHRLRRVVAGGSPIDKNITLIPLRSSSDKARLVEIWTRTYIEGWLSEEDAEKLLMWEILKNENQI